MESVISKETNANVTMTVKMMTSVALMDAKKNVLKSQAKNMVNYVVIKFLAANPCSILFQSLCLYVDLLTFQHSRQNVLKLPGLTFFFPENLSLF